MCTQPGDKAEDSSEAFHHTRFFLCGFVSSLHCPFHESSLPALRKTPGLRYHPFSEAYRLDKF